MAFQTQVIAGIGTATAVQLVVAGSGAPASGTFKNVTGNQSDPIVGIIQNLDATNSAIIGGSDVQTTGGVHLSPGQALPFSWVGTEATTLFSVSSAATISVAVMLDGQ